MNRVDEVVDLVEVQPRLRPDIIAPLPVAALFGTRPGHGLTQDVAPSKVHEPEGTEGPLQHLHVTALPRLRIEPGHDQAQGSPHDTGPEDTVGRAAEPHRSGHELVVVERTVLANADPKASRP